MNTTEYKDPPGVEEAREAERRIAEAQRAFASRQQCAFEDESSRE